MKGKRKVMANAKTAKPKKKKQAKSFILTLGLILLVGYFVITLIGLQLERKERNEVLQQKTAEHEQIVAENEHLQSVLDNEDKSDYIEQIAREKLGYVMPGEKVFYDVTPGA